MEIDKEIGRILHGFQPACVLMTANRLGMFDVIKSPAAADAVAGKLGLSVKGTERLLNALAGMGVVVKLNERFQLPEEWQKYLCKDGDQSMQQWIRLMDDLHAVWIQLPDFVGSGTMIRSIMDMLGSDPEQMRAFTDAMHDKGLKATWLIAREIPIGDASRMLDVGGGPGTYALEWAKLHPHLRATIFDIAPVLEVAKEYIARYGLQDRIDTRPGDFLKDDLGDGYDLVLLANVLHMYPADLGKALVAKAARALAPGGRLIVHGFCTDEDDTGPLEDALFSLGIGMLTESGRAHPVREKIGWMEEAGIGDIRHFRIEAIPTGVLTGKKAK